jgi:hypothetical protein
VNLPLYHDVAPYELSFVAIYFELGRVPNISLFLNYRNLTPKTPELISAVGTISISNKLVVS